jgi:Leucine-rich repeat (LRR) protein
MATCLINVSGGKKMLTQFSIPSKKIKVEGKEQIEEEHINSLSENLNDEEGDFDENSLDDCPYTDPNYDGPYSTLDDYPDLVTKIQTQTVRPELIIERFRESLDISILNLWACRLNVQNIDSIVLPFLEQNPQITELRIAGNDIGDEGSKLLATNQTIKKLDASVNNITDIGVAALCQNKNITCLHIDANSFTEKAMEVLANNAALTELHISLNQLHTNIDKGALKFFLKNDTLNVFRCSGVTTEILDSFWKELIEQRKLRNQDRKRAFLMGCHSQLGKNSPILTLYRRGGKNVIAEIFSYVKAEPLRFHEHCQVNVWGGQ